MNTLGRVLRLTSFGESHGVAIGGVLDGYPAGVDLNLVAVQDALDRRKPGQSAIVTQRKESDQVVFLSGIFEGKSTGTPIAFHIPNTNQRSRDYNEIANTFRPSHADWVYEKKYGMRDYRGGGRSSARETANWVVAGALAKQLIPDVSVVAYVHSVGEIGLDGLSADLDFGQIEKNPVRCPNAKIASEMEALIREVKKDGDTIGGTISCLIKGVPVGWGEPIFDKLHARLAHAMMGINAAKGFEYGSGFGGTKMRGSQHNDLQNSDGSTQTNFSGGVQGGISNGMDISFKVGFKPVATLIQKQSQLNKQGELQEVQGKGRHDPCVVPRAVPVVEALAAFTLADFMLLNENAAIS